jgi:hypothetical protein
MHIAFAQMGLFKTQYEVLQDVIPSLLCTTSGPGPNATFLLGEQHLTHEATGRVPKENRGMSLHHYPQLLQSLPGKVQDDIERQPEDVALDKEIEALRETLKGLSTGYETKQDRARWEELYW